jgi:hypothetical protein
MFISFPCTGYQFYETSADQCKQQNKYRIANSLPGFLYATIL